MKRASIIILVFLSACAGAGKLIAPTSQKVSAMQQKVPDMNLEKANHGYALYKTKCAGCHRLHAPAEYTIAKWQKILPEMFIKAKMTNEEDKKLVSDYLYALSK